MIYYNQSLTNSTVPLSSQLSNLDTKDLLLDANGEIQLNPRGGLKISNNQEVLISNLFRRITTPLGGYERYAFVDYEYTAIDEGWSDPLLGALSAPLSPAFTEWAVKRLNDITAKDPRLTVLDVTIVSRAPAPHFQITYTLNDTAYQTNLDLPTAGNA